MREGDLYPELQHARIEAYRVVIQRHYSASGDWLDSQARYMTDQHSVPGVRITMPESDWEAIMEIYRAHYHAQNRNPGVRDAWEQYRVMVGLTA